MEISAVLKEPHSNDFHLLIGSSEMQSICLQIEARLRATLYSISHCAPL